MRRFEDSARAVDYGIDIEGRITTPLPEAPFTISFDVDTEASACARSCVTQDSRHRTTLFAPGVISGFSPILVVGQRFRQSDVIHQEGGSFAISNELPVMGPHRGFWMVLQNPAGMRLIFEGNRVMICEVERRVPHIPVGCRMVATGSSSIGIRVRFASGVSNIPPGRLSIRAGLRALPEGAGGAADR
jgi:hypothetical protein